MLVISWPIVPAKTEAVADAVSCLDCFRGPSPTGVLNLSPRFSGFCQGESTIEPRLREFLVLATPV